MKSWISPCVAIGWTFSAFLVFLQIKPARAEHSIFEEGPTPAQAERSSTKPAQPSRQTPVGAKPSIPQTEGTASIPAPVVKLRLAKPSPTELSQSIRRLNEAYAAQLEDHTATARKKLARTLLDDVSTMASAPSDQYALLLGAYNISRETGNWATCDEAAERLMELFLVDTLSMKAKAVLTGPVPTDRSPEAVGQLEVAVKVVDQLIAGEDYDTANKVLLRLKSIPTNPVFQTQILARMKDVGNLIQDQKQVLLASEKLKANADDAAANRTVGIYQCMTRNNWESGLAFLAKNSDESLKKLAREEVAANSAVEQAETIADGWYDQAHRKDKALSDAQKLACLKHAISWYELARPNAQGLLLKKIANRTSELPGGSVQGKEIVNSIGQKYVRIEKGTFNMGTPEDEAGHNKNELLHKVTLTKPFYMGIHPVTRGEFEAFVNATHYQTDAEKSGSGYVFEANSLKHVKGASWRTPGFNQTSAHPVVVVSHPDSLAYLAWLNTLPAEKAAGRHYRLPTEAEWEYACRAGTTTAFNTGTTLAADQANYFNRKGTTPVGMFPPNAWGLFDMHGNVWQWCADGMSDYGGDGENPKGPESGRSHVMRGGSWYDVPPDCRSGKRGTCDTGLCLLGFRVVLD
jgi:formylglycine-generating enzyme required for sulfatase activity